MQRVLFSRPAAVAVLSVLAALLITSSLLTIFGSNHAIFFFFTGAVIISAWYGGLYPGLLATLLSLLLVSLFILPPVVDPFHLLEHGLLLLAFALVAVAISWLQELSRRVRQRLEDTMAHLRLTMYLTRMGTWDFDPASLLVSTSASTDLIHGLSPHPVPHPLDQYLSQVHPEDRAPLRQAMLAAAASGTSLSFEYRLLSAGGEQRWIAARGNLLQDKQGSSHRLVGALFDITDRKQMEETLRESEARFRTMADHAPVMIWVTEPNGNCSFLSKSWYDFTGQTPQTGLGWGWLEAVHPEDRDQIQAAFLNANQTQTAFQFDCRLCRWDGEYHWALDSGSPRFGPQGEFLGFIGTVMDIMERKQAETILRESEHRWHRILEHMPVLLLANDEHAVPLLWNQECERVTGYSAAEMVGNPQAFQLIYPDLVEIEQLIHQGHQWRGDYRNWEATLTRKDGEQRTIAWTSIAKEFPVEGWANWSVGVDITERKRVEQRTQVLQAVVAALSKALTLEEVAEVILTQATATLGATAGAIALLDETGKSLSLLKAVGYADPVLHYWEHFSLDTPNLALAAAVRTQTPLWLQTPEDWPEQVLSTPHDAIDDQKRAWAALPLIVDSRIIGGLKVSFSTEHRFDAAERGFILLLTQYCAQALERARLYEAEVVARQAAEQAARRIARLQMVTAALSETLTIPEVARVIVDQGAAVLDAVSGNFQSCVEDGTAFEMIYLAGSRMDDQEAVKWQRYPADPALPITAVVHTKQALWFEDNQAVARDYPALESYAQVYPGASALLPILIGGRVVAVVNFTFAEPRRFTKEERSFALALIQQCGQALERARLAEQAREAAALAERQRLARDLHDAISQTLFSATTIAEAVPRLWQRKPERAVDQLEQVVILNRAAMAEMRNLLLELRPEAILRNTLVELLTHLTDAAKGRKGVETELVVEGSDQTLPPEVHVALYRIAQEGINNILKHSQATRFAIHLSQQPEQIELSITDNGKGFDPDHSFSGLGLSTMQERAEAIGAALAITSHVGGGTTVRLTWRAQPAVSAGRR